MYLEKPKRLIIWNGGSTLYKGNTYETTQYFNNCRKGSYKESFCGTLPERSSIPSGKTCFVPLLLSGKKKSNRQEKIRENY